MWRVIRENLCQIYFLVEKNLINKISYPLILLLAFNYGCATRRVQIREEPYPKDSYLIQNVPFYKQTGNTCGPAALASVLAYWGIKFDYTNLLQSVYSPELGGSLDFETSFYARKFDLWSRYYQTGLDDLKAKIKEGIPLIVMQKESPLARDYHYIVAFGFDDQEKKIVAHIGRRAYAVISYDRFMRMWKDADFAAIVIAPPEKVTWPLDVQGYTYLGYLLEKKDLLERASDIYLKAVSLDPGAKVAYFNLGNVYFKMSKFDRAEESFQKVIQLDANFADAYNNLACVYLSENIKLKEAEALVQKASELNPQGKKYYLDTLEQIKQRGEK